MPVNLKAVMDGTGRPPRPSQVDAMDWLETNWDKADVLGLQLPPGVGKTFLARTIQRATGARIVVPSNMLMDDQYTPTYPEVNALKGQSHYSCKSGEGMTCNDRRELGFQPCPGCPYREARKAALDNRPTFFNPMSLYYVQKEVGKYKPSKVLVVDEADKLISMLLLLSGKKFPERKWGAPKALDQLTVLTWLEGHAARLRKEITAAGVSGDFEKYSTALRAYEGFDFMLDGIKDSPQNYVFFTDTQPYYGREEPCFNVIPIEPPPALIRKLLDSTKIILLSATLFDDDIVQLAAGRTYLKYDSGSPIPVEQRELIYKPLNERMNYKTPPETVVNHVLTLLRSHQGENAIVHATYDQARRWGPLMRSLPLITHTAENKEEKVREFKAKGGVFLASGCAEGIDLPGDQCRVNIIPSLQRLNPEDPAVKRQLAKEGGRKRYEMQALKTVVQQHGRSNRGVDDKSVSYICDPQFPEYHSRNRQHLPKSFNEAVRYSVRRPKET